jgi:cytochrome P450
MTIPVSAERTLKAVARPPGLLHGLDRWLVPRRFLDWTEAVPERYKIELPLAPTVLLTCSPEDCRVVFSERDGALLFGEGLRRFAPHEAMFGHDALDALDGEDHTRFRRLLTAAFHGEALKGYEQQIVAITEREVARWPVGEPVAFAELARELAREVIAAVVFGVTAPARNARLQRALDRLDRALTSLELAGRFAAAILMRGRWAPYPTMTAIHAEIAAVTHEEIAERRATPQIERSDCLEHFLRLDPDAAGALSDDEIVAAMRVLVIAGWATTANTLAWLAERLARHPDALARCAEDARDGSGRYLVATVQETLRMRPPVPITVRYVARDFDLRGLMLKRGALVATDIERMHYRPDLYPDARAFRPERFLDQRPGTYTWIPFGGGAHRCIGAGFALTEAQLILQTLLRQRTIKHEPARGEPSRRSTLITAPARRARVTLISV